MPATMDRARAGASAAYVNEQLAGLTPVELLLKVYDVALASCRRGDRERLSRALVELISALDFNHREVAIGLFQMYNFCLTNAKRGRFDLVEPVLTELREAWTSLAAQQKAEAAGE